jgi:predicted double-glycine peptidase
MDNNKFYKWLFEAKKNVRNTTKNFYVLVGPPAVGKTSWIDQFVKKAGETFTIISRDQIIEDQIFPKYKLANKELYTVVPPKDSVVGETVKGFEKYGKVIEDRKGRKAYKNILEANEEVEKQIKKQTAAAFSTKPQNIIIDAINGTDTERKRAISLVTNHPEYKKIAVYFEFEPYKKEIEARAQERAKGMQKQLGASFARSVSKEDYSKIFPRITKPHSSEGFDEIQSYDSFKGVKTATMQPTAESLTIGFRKFLNEEVNQNNFGVVKTGSGLNVNYVLIDTNALLNFYKSLDPQNPDIKRKDLIDNNIVVSAIKIAENTEELKAEYGSCMHASHVKVSAVNKNLKGKGFGKLLYKIIMSEHPEGLTPDRDFVSTSAKKAWVDMASSGVKVKKIKDTDKNIDVFDDVKNPKTPTPEDDCVIHPRYDGDPLNRAYLYSGENTDAYLMRAHEALATCEEMIANGWTIEALEDLIVDAGMTLYDIAIGYEGDLQEARLSKVWKKRAKARAIRQERSYDKSDLKWAHKRQADMHKKHPELEEEYLKEIEAAKQASKAAKEYLLKMKEIRKKRMEEKKQEMVAPTTANLKKRAKPAPNPYNNPEYRKTKFKSRTKWLEKHRTPSHVGDIAPMTEESESNKNFIGIENVRQSNAYSCGAACLMQILSYYNKFDGNESELSKELKTNHQSGTSPENIVKIANKYGLESFVKENCTIQDLKGFVASKTPVILSYQAWSDDDREPWSEEQDDGHYSVLIGIDDKNIYINDPSLLNKKGYLPIEEFKERWHDEGYKNMCIVVRGSEKQKNNKIVKVNEF